MILYEQKHADLPNVGASQLGSISIPARNNHHALKLNFLDVLGDPVSQADIETDVDWVSVHLTRMGQQIKILDRISPAEIFDLLNDYPEAALSTYVNDGVMQIPYDRPGRLRVQNWSLCLGMADIDVYQLQVQFTAALATVATIEVIPVVDRLALRPLGEHIQLRVDTRDRAAIGKETVDNAPFKEPGTALMGYHIGMGTAPGVIHDVEVNLDDQIVYSSLDAAMNDLNLHRRGFTPNADYFSVPLDLDFEPLDVGNAKSFIQKWNWTTAPITYRVIYELVCGLGLPNK